MSSKSGIVKDIKHLKIIRSLPSTRSLKIMLGLGDELQVTVGSKSTYGQVVLINSDLSVLEADFRSTVALQDDVFDLFPPSLSLPTSFEPETVLSQTAIFNQSTFHQLLFYLMELLKKCSMDFFSLVRRFSMFCVNQKFLRFFLKTVIVSWVSFYLFCHIAGLSTPLLFRILKR
jgi:hypothetical protein